MRCVMSRSQPNSVARRVLDAPRLTPRNRSAYSAIEIPMDTEIAGLEQKLATLLADYHRLRAENESFKRELGRSLEQNRALNARIAAATARLDSLLLQLPESTG